MDQWWTGHNEVPLVTISLGPMPSNLPSAPADGDWARAWLDLEGRLARAVPLLTEGTYLAETFPAFEPNLGPDILSTIFGLELEFEPSTSWGKPLADTMAGLRLEPDFNAPMWQDVERFTRASCALSQGRWITMITDLHPNLDVLSALLGPENLCLELLDHPDDVASALRVIDRAVEEAFQRLNLIIKEGGVAYGSWMRNFSRRPTHIVQCDFSAMISPAQFQTYALASLRAEMALAECRVYHLDGPDALRHLDALLAEPGIEAIQWVYGAGHGPAREWVDVYQRILAAGKSIRVECESVDDIAALHPILGARGVWYACGVATRDEATAVLRMLGRTE